MTTKTTDQAGTTLEHRIGPRGRFVLNQPSGEISIKGVEGDTARVRSLDDRSLSEMFSIDTGDDHVELRGVDKFGLGILTRHGSGAEIAIEVPHGATVTIDTGSADIEASDLSGEKRFRSASGDVALSRLAGAIDVETVSGEIEIDGSAPLDLVAKSVSGDIDVRVPSLRRLDMGTTSGDIQLDAQLSGEGPFAVRSISGDVEIVGRSSFRVEAESITGDLSSDVAAKRESQPGRKVLIVGRPGPTLKFRSVSGDFHVKQPRDAAPEPPAHPEAPTPPEPPAFESSPPATPPAPQTPGASTQARQRDTENARLEILRELERGDITVAEATDRLSSLDEVLR